MARCPPPLAAGPVAKAERPRLVWADASSEDDVADPVVDGAYAAADCLGARTASGSGAATRLSVLRMHVRAAEVHDLREQLSALKADHRLELKARLKQKRRR